MLPPLREVRYQGELLSHQPLLLVGDIGGTNSNFGIVDVRSSHPKLLVSLHMKSREIVDYTQTVAELCEYIKQKYKIMFHRACIGAAGVVAENRMSVIPTNVHKLIDAQAMSRAASLDNVILINDFEAVALGIDYINPKDLVQAYGGNTRPYAHKACIGAGTGMGKAALLWNRHLERYLPFASEGGHADCAGQTAQEIDLFAMIKQERAAECDGAVSWEEVLSGDGIQRIYRFLQKTGRYKPDVCSREIRNTGFSPDAISHYARYGESLCVDTFLLYATLYARCARNFVLDVLALNGVYIAGGIAAKNVDLFLNPVFLREFLQCGRQSTLLKNVPIFVIADYNVSLFGAAVFMNLYDQGIV